MRVMITGSAGQLGRELLARVLDGVDVHEFDHARLDVVDRDAVETAVRSLRPEVIINAAAYTNVDGAETETDRAFAVNASGAEHVAAAGTAVGARIIHVSTDYVFDGSASTPYRTEHAPIPVSAYGKSKLEGERRAAAASGGRAVILRTSWLYSRHGRNFVTVMLELMRAQHSIRVVYDQVGTPTWAGSLARTVWKFAAQGLASGVYHCTDSGVASWYDFSVAILEEAIRGGLVADPVPIVPVLSSEFPRPARRPPYSVLDKTRARELLGDDPPHWRQSLRAMLEEYAHGA